MIVRYILLLLPLLCTSFKAAATEPDNVPAFGGHKELPAGYTNATFDGEDIQYFRRWIAENVCYPEECREAGIEGRVIVSFVVERWGGIRLLEVEQSPDRMLKMEVLRVLSQTQGRWRPGTDSVGTPINIKYTVPVNFRLEDEEEYDVYDGLLLPDGFGHAAFDGDGDSEHFRLWVTDHVQYPSYVCVEGKVVAFFVVDTNGNACAVEIFASPDRLLSVELEKVIESSSGMWEPGTDGEGTPVCIKYPVVVDFTTY